MARRDTPTPTSLANEPAAYMPPPPTKTGRDRSWEREQRTGDFVQVSYRRIPRELRDKISDISQKTGVTSDEIARAFFEYAMQAYQSGDLKLNPRPKTGRFTLY